MERAAFNSWNLASSQIKEGDSFAPHKSPRDAHDHRQSGSGRAHHCLPCRDGSWCPRHTVIGPVTLACSMIFRNTSSKHEGKIFLRCERQTETDCTNWIFHVNVQHFPLCLPCVSALEGKPSLSTPGEMAHQRAYTSCLCAAAKSCVESRRKC